MTPPTRNIQLFPHVHPKEIHKFITSTYIYAVVLVGTRTTVYRRVRTDTVSTDGKCCTVIELNVEYGIFPINAFKAGSMRSGLHNDRHTIDGKHRRHHKKHSCIDTVASMLRQRLTAPPGSSFIPITTVSTCCPRRSLRYKRLCRSEWRDTHATSNTPLAWKTTAGWFKLSAYLLRPVNFLLSTLASLTMAFCTRVFLILPVFVRLFKDCLFFGPDGKLNISQDYPVRLGSSGSMFTFEYWFPIASNKSPI